MTKTVFIVPALDCPSEEKLIENQLKKIHGIEKLECNFVSQELIVTHSLKDVNLIKKAIEHLGMKAIVKDKINQIVRIETIKFFHRKWLIVGVSGLFALLAEVGAYLLADEKKWTVIALSLIAIFLSGWPTFRKGLIAIRTFTLNINFLMIIAISGAIIIGEWPEAAMVTVLFALAELIEGYSFDKARHAIKDMMDLSPQTASVKTQDGWEVTPVEKINIDEIIWAKPGERIALDGIIINGKTTINQAAITGESMPIEKREGDIVFAGTLNQFGSIQYRVTAKLSKTLLAKIIHTVEEAQAERAPTQRFVDQFSKYYTPIMVLLALAIAFLPPYILMEPLMPWVYKALVLLVIACPCALVISTPVTVVSGLASAARHGILIKGGVYLENGHKLKVIAFDKTGTLTVGEPSVTDVLYIEDENHLLSLPLAAALDSHSEHPIAEAIVAKWKTEYPNQDLISVEEFETIPGRGVTGLMHQQRYFLGNHRLAEDNNVCNEKIESILRKLEESGKTTVLLTTEKNVIAILAVADILRDEAKKSIDNLHKLRIKTIMITGDNPLTAKSIAESLKIDEVKANQLPHEKLDAIDLLLKNYKFVGMVGDGINDAPALAKATIGFAMGNAGTDTALETADVALMEDNLTKISLFVKISRKTSNILIQNIVFSILVKFVFFGLALVGLATLWMAVFADMGASLIVVMNGLRILKFAEIE